MSYQDLFTALNAAKVRYLVVGGVAMVLHGAVRMTADLDLAISLDAENVRRFLDLMKGSGYLPKIPVSPDDFADPKHRKKWKEEKNMTVFSWHHPRRPEELLDVFIEEPLDFISAYARKTDVPLGSTSVPVVSIIDLIRMKEKTGRPQDLADVAALQDMLK